MNADELCFKRCVKSVSSFREPKLSEPERQCISTCSDKFLAIAREFAESAIPK